MSYVFYQNLLIRNNEKCKIEFWKFFILLTKLIPGKGVEIWPFLSIFGNNKIQSNPNSKFNRISWGQFTISRIVWNFLVWARKRSSISCQTYTGPLTNKITIKLWWRSRPKSTGNWLFLTLALVLIAPLFIFEGEKVNL